MTVRAREPQEGALDFPGGFVQPGEHPFDNARREMLEELGVHVQTVEHVGYATDTYGAGGPPTLQVGMAVSISFAAKLKPADDVSHTVWVDPLTLDRSKIFAATGQLKLLDIFLEGRQARSRKANPDP